MTRRKFLEILFGGAALLAGGFVGYFLRGEEHPEYQTTQPPHTSPTPTKVPEEKPEVPTETSQHIKNIWTENPDYVGKKLEDFVMPDELKGKLEHEEEISIPIHAIVKAYEPTFDDINKYYEGRDKRTGEVVMILYGKISSEKGGDWGVSLIDYNKDGIIDYYEVYEEDRRERQIDLNGDGKIDKTYFVE